MCSPCGAWAQEDFGIISLVASSGLPLPVATNRNRKCLVNPSHDMFGTSDENRPTRDSKAFRT
jgi:hypothetical protein